MHIGLCSPQWPPSGAANGIVTYVSAIRAYFLAQGHDVSVIAQEQLFDAAGKAHPIAPSPPARQSFDPWRNRLARKVDRWRGNLPGMGRAVADQIIAARRIAPIDIVEMEESFGWCDIVQRTAGVPIVTRIHGPHFMKPARPRTPQERYLDGRRCAAEGRAIRSSRSLTAPTRAMMDAVHSHYGIRETGMRTVIPNPIAIQPEPRRWRLDQSDRDLILMVGRFDFWKGADTMLAAFAELLARRPNARLTLVGPDLGMETAPGRISNFEEYARAHLPPEARARVTFTGPLPPERIAPLRQRAFATVIASRLENFPYTLLEGLATGCPIISTAWAGSEEIIDDGESGLLTPVGEAEPLARRLDWLIAHPDAAGRLAANGLRRCRQHFSLEAAGGKMLQHYEATLRASTQ